MEIVAACDRLTRAFAMPWTRVSPGVVDGLESRPTDAEGDIHRQLKLPSTVTPRSPAVWAAAG
jgi:hypothetical protein